MRLNCPDEEAGLLSYLQLYYCRLPHAKPFAFIILVVWLGLLFSTIGIAASDFFCINLSTIASILGMSESMAGVTFLAFGNGSPDVFSTFAAMKTHSGSLAVGELIGAAGFITAVVAGSMALVRPFKVARRSFIRDVGFFIVAASFSMVFLADGHLHMWECAVMVGFYVFYVAIVVLWHWYFKTRNRRRALEDAARSHFNISGPDEAVVEPYHDDDEDASARKSKGPSRISSDDFANLERGGSPLLRAMDEEVDADDETRDRYLAEISSNMRVSRPGRGERRNTMTPIRPSLVGALEFNAVLSSLQKSRNIQTIPINLRRYSDDPTFTLSQQQHQITSRASNPNFSYEDVDAHDVIASDHLRPSGEVARRGPNRARAVSTNDAATTRRDSRPLEIPGNFQVDVGRPDHDSFVVGEAEERIMVSSTEPLQSELGYMTTSPIPMSPNERHSSGDLLAPSGDQFALLQPGRYQPLLEVRQRDLASSRAPTEAATRPSISRLQIPASPAVSETSSPASEFPAFSDDPAVALSRSRAPSIRLPPPSIESGSESAFHHTLYEMPQEKPLRYWPYKFLPSPLVLTSTLFPTLYTWHNKNIWERMLGIVAAPSVFLLAITLPIVEANKEEADLDQVPIPDPGLLTPEYQRSRSSTTLIPAGTDGRVCSSTVEPGQKSQNSGTDRQHTIGSPLINVTSPPDLDSQQPRPSLPRFKSSTRAHDHPVSIEIQQTSVSSPKEWNRWLVATQIFTAPFFVLLIIHANINISDPGALIFPTLYTLIGSLTAFALLLLLTTPQQAPKYHHLLCYFGFIVAIAWISTIAGEVVGVLKALGIILNISDAILGLTIFAVGNSLGDLVADITVARLGYPVMALSACFGGPMLNILLGIGLSGLYMTIRGGEKRHERHPDRALRYKPYQIEVGGTLLISGATLLVTLAGLLVVVPLRGWRMDRYVGWGLVVLWTLSTIGNVVVEVMGWGG